MINPWFKFFGGEYLSDLKILQLTGNERSCWVTLLCLAGQTKDGVVKFLSEKQLLLMSGVSEDIRILDRFQELQMIEVCNGDVTVLNWTKRQYSESVNRVREFRKRSGNTEVTTEENREEEKRIEKIRIDKDIYGEFEKVLLSSEEHQKLIEKLGERNTEIMIAELDSGIASKGYKYKSHYATILNWARRRVVEHNDKKINRGKSVV